MTDRQGAVNKTLAAHPALFELKWMVHLVLKEILPPFSGEIV